MQYCYQQVKVVDTDLTLSLPDMEISAKYPPVPVEHTARFAYGGSSNQTGFPWLIQQDLALGFMLLGNNTNNTRNSVPSSAISQLNNSVVVSSSEGSVSNFFLGVAFGSRPIAIDELTRNANPSEVFEHIQGFYRRYMAQVFAIKMRSPRGWATNGTQAPNVGLIENPDQILGSFTPSVGIPRVIQNRTPTTILTVLLTTMFICGALAWFFGDLHDIVPWNPWTIAGTMVLFTNSRMLELADNEDRIRYKAGIDNDRPAQQTSDTNLASIDNATGLHTITETTLYPSEVENGRKTHDPAGRGLLIENDLSDKESSEQPRLAADTKKSIISSVVRARRSSGLSIEGSSKDPSALRLGWWKDGVYQGPRLPKAKSSKGIADGDVDNEKTQLDEGWEYRIDVL